MNCPCAVVGPESVTRLFRPASNEGRGWGDEDDDCCLLLLLLLLWFDDDDAMVMVDAIYSDLDIHNKCPVDVKDNKPKESLWFVYC